MIWPLLIASVFALALIIERFVALQRNKIIPSKVYDEALAVAHQRRATPEVVNTLEQGSPLGRLLAAALRGFRRQALHAETLEFVHPATGEPVRVSAPVPADLLQLLAAEKVTVGFGVPVIWAGLLAAMRRTEVRLPEFKRALVGGSALPPSMAEAFQRDYGIALTHAWGMTETSPIGTINTSLSKHDALPAQEQQKQRTGQGRPIFGIELQVVDVDGEPLPRDGQSQGYLQVRGHWVVEQYYGQDASALTAAGWFDTGDIGTLDANGYLVISDRAKDIIKSGGEWISTVELENIAIAHPGVRSAAAIAARHPRWDERPVLLCVRAEGGEVEETDLLSWFATRVPKWQIPDRVIFVDALPVSATGKVLKNQLRQAYGEILMSEGK